MRVVVDSLPERQAAELRHLDFVRCHRLTFFPAVLLIIPAEHILRIDRAAHVFDIAITRTICCGDTRIRFIQRAAEVGSVRFAVQCVVIAGVDFFLRQVPVIPIFHRLAIRRLHPAFLMVVVVPSTADALDCFHDVYLPVAETYPRMMPIL